MARTGPRPAAAPQPGEAIPVFLLRRGVPFEVAAEVVGAELPVRDQPDPEALWIFAALGLLGGGLLGRLLHRGAAPKGLEVASPERPPPPRPAVAVGARCPVCAVQFAEMAVPAALCLHCGTPHHRDCLDLVGGCAVFGCAPP